jgi:nucleoside-diphosphate-sugar epimerase
MKVEKILLTGITGFLGSEVFCRLGIQVGFENLIVLGRKIPDPKTSLLARRLVSKNLDPEKVLSKVLFVQSDFNRADVFRGHLEQIFKEHAPQFCVHMAAMIKPPQGVSEFEQERANFGVTQDLLDFSQKYKIKRFLFTSSVVAFGGTLSPTIRSEKDFGYFLGLCKTLPYFTSKRKAHLLVEQQRFSEFKVPYSLVCPGIVHGALDSEKNSRAHLVKLVHGKLPFVPQGGGNFVGLDRVADMHCQEILRQDSEDSVRLAVDQNLSFFDYFEKYLRIYNEIMGKKIEMPKFSFPRQAGQGVGVVASLMAMARVPLGHFLDPVIASSLYLYFKSDFKMPETIGLDQSLRESIASTKLGRE